MTVELGHFIASSFISSLVVIEICCGMVGSTVVVFTVNKIDMKVFFFCFHG